VKNNWIVTIRLEDMPNDADVDSIGTLLEAILDSNGVVPYKIIKIEKDATRIV
jgi:hypothetical protein